MKRTSGLLFVVALLAALALGIAAAIGAAKFVSRAKDQARKQVALANLHCLGTAIQFYPHRYGAYPDGLDVLYAQGTMGDNCKSLLLDPLDARPLPLGESGMLCSYQYVGGVPGSIPEETIIAYSRKGIHTGERVVLYADRARTVEWVSETELHSGAQAGRHSLRASYEAVAGALGDKLTEQRDAQLREFYEVRD